MYIYIFVGQTESFEDQLRSILAQYHFVHEINKFEASGEMFRTYMYVPEVHPHTKQTFYEREDEAHLIKIHVFEEPVIAMHIIIVESSVWQPTLEVVGH